MGTNWYIVRPFYNNISFHYNNQVYFETEFSCYVILYVFQHFALVAKKYPDKCLRYREIWLYATSENRS